MYAISYANAFVVATAESLNAVLVSGDPKLKQLEDRIRIEKLRRE